MSDVRLIDANSFKRFLQALCKAGAPYDEVIQLLDKEPTAYNPEKVVGEIKSSATDNDGLIVKDGNEPMIWKSKAIDIVKRGGVE